MERAVRCLKTKTVVSAAGLELFCDEFAQAREMIDSLIEMTELAATHPKFGTPGHPGAFEYDCADRATDALETFFASESCVEEDAHGPPRVVVHYQRRTIEILRKRYRSRRKPAPSFANATTTVAMRLTAREHARNQVARRSIFRVPSLTKRLAARTSITRVVRNSLGLKAPRGWGWLTNPKRAAYNRLYSRTSIGCVMVLAAAIAGTAVAWVASL